MSKNIIFLMSQAFIGGAPDVVVALHPARPPSTPRMRRRLGGAAAHVSNPSRITNKSSKANRNREVEERRRDRRRGSRNREKE
jgi:hypothetical protein